MRRKGSILLEFVFGFPLVLMLIMAVFQFAQIEIARLVVHYAAYCGARAALVHQDGTAEAATAAARAAERVCAWITFDDDPAAPGTAIVVPGWGAVPSSEATARKTVTTCTLVTDPASAVRVQVTHRLSLLAPLVGPMIAQGLQLWSPRPDGNADMYTTDWELPANLLYPSLAIPASCLLPKPFRTLHATGPLP